MTWIFIFDNNFIFKSRFQDLCSLQRPPASGGVYLPQITLILKIELQKNLNYISFNKISFHSFQKIRRQEPPRAVSRSNLPKKFKNGADWISCISGFLAAYRITMGVCVRLYVGPFQKVIEKNDRLRLPENAPRSFRFSAMY